LALLPHQPAEKKWQDWISADFARPDYAKGAPHAVLRHQVHVARTGLSVAARLRPVRSSSDELKYRKAFFDENAADPEVAWLRRPRHLPAHVTSE
jgi:hypothetical protein